MPEHIQHPTMLPREAPYSDIVRDEDTVFLAGIVATDMASGAEIVGDIAAETRLVMQTVQTLLASVGLGMDAIVRVDVHLTDLDDMDAMNAVYGSFFAEDKRPARTTTESARLAGGSNVKITCMARHRS